LCCKASCQRAAWPLLQVLGDYLTAFAAAIAPYALRTDAARTASRHARLLLSPAWSRTGLVLPRSRVGGPDGAASSLLGVLGTDAAAHELLEVALLQHGALWKVSVEALQTARMVNQLACRHCSCL
jgi:hypothetical protein